MCWFDILLYYKVITILALVNTPITSHNNLFFLFFVFVVRTFKILLSEEIEIKITFRIQKSSGCYDKMGLSHLRLLQSPGI